MSKADIESGLLARYEQALHDAANLHRAYQIARLAVTSSALKELYNEMEDSRARADSLRLEVLLAIDDY